MSSRFGEAIEAPEELGRRFGFPGADEDVGDVDEAMNVAAKTSEPITVPEELARSFGYPVDGESLANVGELGGGAELRLPPARHGGRALTGAGAGGGRCVDATDTGTSPPLRFRRRVLLFQSAGLRLAIIHFIREDATNARLAAAEPTARNGAPAPDSERQYGPRTRRTHLVAWRLRGRSAPPGSDVLIAGNLVGTTPLTVNLNNHEGQRIITSHACSRPGFRRTGRNSRPMCATPHSRPERTRPPVKLAHYRQSAREHIAGRGFKDVFASRSERASRGAAIS